MRSAWARSRRSVSAANGPDASAATTSFCSRRPPGPRRSLPGHRGSIRSSRGPARGCGDTRSARRRRSAGCTGGCPGPGLRSVPVPAAGPRSPGPCERFSSARPPPGSRTRPPTTGRRRRRGAPGPGAQSPRGRGRFRPAPRRTARGCRARKRAPARCGRGRASPRRRPAAPASVPRAVPATGGRRPAPSAARRPSCTAMRHPTAPRPAPTATPGPSPPPARSQLLVERLRLAQELPPQTFQRLLLEDHVLAGAGGERPHRLHRQVEPRLGLAVGRLGRTQVGHRLAPLPGHAGQPRHQGQEQPRGQRRHRRVPPRPPPRLLGRGDAPRLDRLVVQEPLQVLRQRRRRGIPPRGSRSIAFWTIVSRSRGMWGTSPRSRSGSSLITRRISSWRSDASKAGRNASSS